MNKLYIIPLILLVFAACTPPREPHKYDTFASCLKEKGAIMYGTEWCPYCKNQKKLFGPSFDKVYYVDCDANKAKCGNAGVTGYPTWILSDGSKLVGAQKLSKLGEITGCTLPSE